MIEFHEVKDAKKTIINFTFNIDYKREDIIKKMLMQRLILNYTNDLKTIKDYNQMKENLYIMSIDSEFIKDKDNGIYSIKFTIPKSDIIKQFDLDRIVQFIYDTLFNPYITNKKFNLEAFNKELDYLKDKEKDYPHSIGEYASDIFLDFVDEDKKSLLHYDEYINYLNTITSEDVYEYYLKNIKNNDFIIYVFGNIEEKDKIISSLNKYFKSNKVIAKEINSFEFLKVKNYKEKNISINYNQSVLNLFYQFDNLKKDDQIKLEMLYYFLNSRENDLLYTELRYKNNLVYQASVDYSIYYGILELRIFFNYKLLDRIEKAIENVFEDLKNKQNYELYKKRLTKAIGYDILNEEDKPFSIVTEIFRKKYLPSDILKVKLDKINNISYEIFLEFLNRMKLTRKMIMKSGEEND